MKNIKIIVLMFFYLMMTISCINNSKARLIADINETNKFLPNNNYNGVFDKIQYDSDKNEVLFLFILNDLNKFNSLTSSEPIMENLSILLSSDDFKPVLNDLIGAKSTLKVKYKCNETSQEFDFVFLPEQLKSISKMKYSEEDRAANLLKNSIEVQNQSFPEEVETGIIVQEVIDGDDYVIYTFILDDSIYDTDYLFGNINLLKEDLNNADPDMKRFISILKPLNKGLIYRYVNSKTRKSADVVYSAIELKLIL